MKNSILGILFSLIAYSSIGQTPYYDALKLDQYLDQNGLLKYDSTSMVHIAEIIQPYIGEQANNLKPNQILQQIGNSGSPYFNALIAKHLDLDHLQSATGYGGISMTDIGSTLQNQGIISAIGGLDVTNLADGLAQFLISRAKQELNTYFFQKLEENLNKVPELKALFPETTEKLSLIGSELYQYDLYLQGLRTAFQMDLRDLLNNVPHLLQTERISSLLTDLPEVRLLLNVGLYITNELKSSTHPIDLLNKFPSVFAGDTLPQSINAGIQSLNYISQSLRSTDTSQVWIPLDSIEYLFKDKNRAELFLGLLAIGTPKEIVFPSKTSTQITLQSILLEATNDYSSIESFIKGIASSYTDVKESLEEIKSISGENQDLYHYYKVFDAALEFVVNAEEIQNLPFLAGKIQINTQLGEILYIANKGTDLYLNIQENDYASAILNLVSIIDTSLSPNALTFLKTNADSLAPTSGAGAGPKAFEDKIDAFSEARRLILKYGSFMAAVVRSESADDVQSAIEAVALPAGSYSVKRHSSFNISINAYIGGHYSQQSIPSTTVDKTASFGVSAPIGISFSKALKKKGAKKTAGSLSLFTQILDIGAIASFRLNDTQTQTLPSVSLQNIFAPGLYLIWGIGNTPLSLGAGGQIGPSLYEVTSSTAANSEKLNTRYGVFLTVDIPMFNLLTR